VKAMAVALAVLMFATGCASAAFHPADGPQFRTLSECREQHPADPELCEPRQVVADGGAIATVALLVLYTALIVLIAVGGGR
jgi:hypothetical protein